MQYRKLFKYFHISYWWKLESHISICRNFRQYILLKSWITQCYYISIRLCIYYAIKITLNISIILPENSRERSTYLIIVCSQRLLDLELDLKLTLAFCKMGHLIYTYFLPKYMLRNSKLNMLPKDRITKKKKKEWSRPS